MLLTEEEAGRAERHALEEARAGRDGVGERAQKANWRRGGSTRGARAPQAERALERARSDRDAAKAELESLKRVHAANIDAIKAESEVETHRRSPTSAAARSGRRLVSKTGGGR